MGLGSQIKNAGKSPWETFCSRSEKYEKRGFCLSLRHHFQYNWYKDIELLSPSLRTFLGALIKSLGKCFRRANIQLSGPKLLFFFLLRSYIYVHVWRQRRFFHCLPMKKDPPSSPYGFYAFVEWPQFPGKLLFANWLLKTINDVILLRNGRMPLWISSFHLKATFHPLHIKWCRRPVVRCSSSSSSFFQPTSFF